MEILPLGHHRHEMKDFAHDGHLFTANLRIIKPAVEISHVELVPIAILAAVFGLVGLAKQARRRVVDAVDRDELVRRLLQHVRREEIARAPTGPVAVCGHVAGRSLVSPWTGRQCVAYRLDAFSGVIGVQRRFLLRHEACSDFRLWDETGTLWVKADKADVLPAGSTYSKAVEPAELPSAIVTLLQNCGAWPPPAGLVLEESLISVGDRAAVFGVLDEVLDNSRQTTGYRASHPTRRILRRSSRYPLAVSNAPSALISSGRNHRILS